ncbi:GNAT family N-acetyltransferase [Streptomyces sp. NPDC091292]|uniref:GNAT family N-acetyltransferase n=1 Tax=Streptomyces sp. NPDC091292 TaxID=3365991 RepID=UPI00382191D2
MKGLRVRGMRDADCESVAAIRIAGWRTAYAGLMPQSHLDALDVTEDAARRRARLAQGQGRVANLVAERDGEVVGWCAHGPGRDEDAREDDAEVYALYVRPDALSTGVGRTLLARTVRDRTADGHRRLLLWVLKENHRARRFYETAGFAPDGSEEPFDVDGTAVPEVRYVLPLGRR